MSLAPEVKEKLVQAALNAKGFKACRYVMDGAPGCVIGQYLASCGVSLKRMQLWGKDEIGKVRPSELAGIESLATSLQLAWDIDGSIDEYDSVTAEDDARLQMLFLIEEAATE